MVIINTYISVNNNIDWNPSSLIQTHRTGIDADDDYGIKTIRYGIPTI